MAKKSRALVSEHLENISRMALEKYQKLIKEFVKGKKGVYALYRGERLKYVGLASNLRIRLNSHLRDRHSQSWDKFSVYLTVDDEHLRELEALVIRIAAPKENRQRGKFAKSENLLSSFRSQINRHHRLEMRKINIAQFRPRRKEVRRNLDGKVPALAPYINKWFKIRAINKWFAIRANYKGKKYIAKVRANGKINFGGEIYHTPSGAGKAIVSHLINGWLFWKYKNSQGQWVPIDELRKK